MKNTLILLFASFAMIACSGEDKKDSSSDSDKSNKDSIGWSSSEIEGAVEECAIEGDSTYKECSCVLDYISKELPYSEFSLAKRILDTTDGPDDPSVTDADKKMVLNFVSVATKALTNCEVFD